MNELRRCASGAPAGGVKDMELVATRFRPFSVGSDKKAKETVKDLGKIIEEILQNHWIFPESLI